jgi:hypothetical protein
MRYREDNLVKSNCQIWSLNKINENKLRKQILNLFSENII